ncbi:MAG: hypothetical protein BV456_07565 [Thermoplasmata archaeon M8B2D]|nr:MAG: hypothetical protein BV456_07565 [Thermoplasmata archaeon M8B2D]
MTEQVLVAPSFMFKNYSGITKIHDSTFSNIFNIFENYTGFMRRDIAETDNKYKQLIPYVVFRCGCEYFVYKRGEESGEKRLVGNYSLGIGGHINPIDGFGYGAYLRAVKREIFEEIIINDWDLKEPIAIINDDSTPVGEVHVGIVHLCTIKHTRIKHKEQQIANANFIHFDKIVEMKYKFENWSQLFINLAERILL